MENFWEEVYDLLGKQFDIIYINHNGETTVSMRNVIVQSFDTSKSEDSYLTIEFSAELEQCHFSSDSPYANNNILSSYHMHSYNLNDGIESGGYVAVAKDKKIPVFIKNINVIENVSPMTVLGNDSFINDLPTTKIEIEGCFYDKDGSSYSNKKKIEIEKVLSRFDILDIED
jgi:hypothetical protein